MTIKCSTRIVPFDPSSPTYTSRVKVKDFQRLDGSSEALVSPSKDLSTSTAKSNVLKEPSKPLKML